MMMQNEFALEAMVDFPDDAGSAPEPISEAHIDAMMRRLVECGVRRVSWGYYGDGHGGCFIPAGVLEEPGRNWLWLQRRRLYAYRLRLFDCLR